MKITSVDDAPLEESKCCRNCRYFDLYAIPFTCSLYNRDVMSFTVCKSFLKSTCATAGPTTGTCPWAVTCPYAGTWDGVTTPCPGDAVRGGR